MIPLAWWALGVLFADSAQAFPAGNLAPLTRAITALWRRLDRPVRSPTPPGPKGSVQGPGMPPPAASGDTTYKGGWESHPSVGCQSCDSAGLTFIYSLTGPEPAGLVRGGRHRVRFASCCCCCVSLSGKVSRCVNWNEFIDPLLNSISTNRLNVGGFWSDLYVSNNPPSCQLKASES